MGVKIGPKMEAKRLVGASAGRAPGGKDASLRRACLARWAFNPGSGDPPEDCLAALP